MINDNKSSLTYIKNNIEIASVLYHKKWNGVWVKYIYVEKEFRHSGVGLELIKYLYDKYGPVYGEFVTAGGVKLYNKFLREFVYDK